MMSKGGSRLAALILVLVGSTGQAAAQGPPGASGAQPPSANTVWGAIAFTADGSYSSAWRTAGKAEAEAQVLRNCSKFNRGPCEVVSFPGELCAAMANYQGSHSGRRYRLSFTGGGTTSPEAQQTALQRCNSDNRTRGRCQLRTVVCGDGR